MPLKLKLKRGDEVVVVAGRDKGKTGRILRMQPKEGRAVVEGVNMVRRHQRPTAADPNGGIVEKEATIALSNLAMVDPKDGRATRVGFRFLADGRKVRFAKRSGEVIDV